MKKIFIFFLIINFCKGQTPIWENFFNNKNLEIIFSETFDKNSKSIFEQLKVTKLGLELRDGIRVSKDFGLTENDNFIFEAEINTEYLKTGEATGISIGSILNKGKVNFFSIPFRSLYRYPRNEKFVRLKFIKLDNVIYNFVNEKLDSYGEYHNFGNAFGFLSPINGDVAYIKKMNLYKIRYFKSDIRLRIHDSGFSSLKFEKLETKKLNQNQIYQVIISVENNGPFDIFNEKTTIIPLDQYDGIIIKIIKYHRELSVGKKEYIHLHFIADNNLKSGKVSYKFRFVNNNLADDTHEIDIVFETGDTN